MVKEVKMGVKLELLPDEDMTEKLNQNIGNHRFIWNQILNEYNKIYKLFQSHSYPLYPSIRTLNSMLKILKQDHAFLRQGESSSQQQVVRDLNKAFKGFFKGLSGYPKFKRKNEYTQTFRIQKNANNVRITNRRIRLAKLGFCRYHTSSKNKKLLKRSLKINNVTIKKEYGKYYAIVNIKTTVNELSLKNKNVGIDLGFDKLATFSTGEEIANLDLKRENDRIKHYQKKLSRQKKTSKNYQKTLSKLHKWRARKHNKKEDAYHKLSKYIVKQHDIIAMEDLNIHGMFQNSKWSPKLQKIRLYELVYKIQYKSNWYGKTFIQIDRFFPSSKKCHICGDIYHDLTLDMREWTCPKCKTHHNRDVNAAINILNEGLRLLSKEKKIIK